MPHLNGVGATSACLREAAPAKAGRPLEREAKASPTHGRLQAGSFTFSEIPKNDLDKQLGS